MPVVLINLFQLNGTGTLKYRRHVIMDGSTKRSIENAPQADEELINEYSTGELSGQNLNGFIIENFQLSPRKKDEDDYDDDFEDEDDSDDFDEDDDEDSEDDVDDEDIFSDEPDEEDFYEEDFDFDDEDEDLFDEDEETSLN